MALTVIESDAFVKGTLSAQTLSIPASTIKNADVASDAAIEAAKLEHQYAIRYSQADGSDVVAVIVPVHIVRGNTATIKDIEVVCVDAPSGGDKALAVDLKKANEGSPAPASVLSSAIAYSATQSDCEVEPGTISSASLADGDTLLVVVTVSGSTGTQGQGLVVTVTIREDAD